MLPLHIELSVLKHIQIGKDAFKALTSITLQKLPKLKSLQFGSSYSSLEELNFLSFFYCSNSSLDLDKLSKIHSPIPLSEKQIIYCFVNVKKQLHSSLLMRNANNVCQSYNYEVFTSYQDPSRKLMKLKNQDFKWKSVERIKKNLIHKVYCKRTLFNNQLLQTNCNDIIPDSYLSFFQLQSQQIVISKSISSRSDVHTSVFESSHDITMSSSTQEQSVISPNILVSMSLHRTSTNTMFGRSITNSAQLLTCSSQLQGQLEQLYITEADDIAELEIVKFPRLKSVIIEKNSIPYVTLVSIHNNPLLESIQIGNGCGNGEIKDLGEEREFSRSVTISMNSSLQDIYIGDCCFKDFDQFELNSNHSRGFSNRCGIFGNIAFWNV